MIEQSISLTKGWNLVSFPYDPVDPRLAEVFRNTSVNMVLGYQNGNWSTAVLTEDGLWIGTLTRIAGGYGYWISALRNEILLAIMKDSARVRVSKGWNLLGIIGDQIQDADTYFKTIDWRVANTLERPVGNVDNDALWQEIHRGDHGNLYPHKGYWVWATGKPTTIERPPSSRVGVN